MKKYTGLTVGLLMTSSLAFAHAHAPNDKPVGVTVAPILVTTQGWDGSVLPALSSGGQTEMKVMKFKILPAGKTSVHVHPMNGAGYIVSGELTMYSTDDPHADFSDPKKVHKIFLKTGDAWTEAVNIWHYGENNGKIPVEFVVIFAGEKGKAATISTTGLPDNC